MPPPPGNDMNRLALHGTSLFLFIADHIRKRCPLLENWLLKKAI